MSWFHAARARVGLLLGGRAAETRMDEEIRFHIDMETDRLVREVGLDPVEARRRAHVAFGGVEGHREEMRDGRGLAWLGGLRLDFKLGFRMLVKYPGLTVVGGLAMAFAIWAGSVTFAMVGLFLDPSLPLPGGDRVVRIERLNVEANQPDARLASDFARWRSELRSFTDLGAFREVPRNLLVGRESGAPVNVAEITAAAFRIATQPPLMGRTLTSADERAEAPPVVLLGYEIWRSRFASDPRVVGRTVRLGETYATVVGVMPEGYAFPVSHEIWTPLRLDPSHGPLEGPNLEVFGRLAPGRTMEQAAAELATIASRDAARSPDTHRHLQLRVEPYAEMFSMQSPDSLAVLLSVEFFAVMLLVLICSNVALLLFARAATRESELVVRSALGASRGRIVAQLFAEALVLGAVAAVIGLAAAHLTMRRWGVEFLELNLGQLPFWFNVGLTPGTVLYAVLLTLLGAGIAGMIPARRITRGLGSSLRESSGGGGGARFGGLWTAVIVTQVAVTVAFPAIIFVQQREVMRIRDYDVGFEAQQYLGAYLDVDESADTAGQNARYQAALERLRQRVAAEPGVAGVTFVDRLPRDYHREYWIELDQPGGAPAAAVTPADPEVSSALIDPSYFEVLRAPVLAGRAFTLADLAPDARVVIVDQGFVEKMLRGRNPVGRRVRLSPRGEWDRDPSRPWYEIVGVVKELGMGAVMHRHRTAGVYLPTVPGRDGPMQMVVHTQGDPAALGPRIRDIATEVDPSLRLDMIQRLDEISSIMLWVLRLWRTITIVLTAVALLLSLAGIYAVLSFAVARRTREIGVRVALGASRGRVITAIFRKPLAQVSTGVAVGAILVTAAFQFMASHTPSGAPRIDGGLTLPQFGMLAAYATGMLAVCMLACVVPTRRALRVQPTEALRAE